MNSTLDAIAPLTLVLLLAGCVAASTGGPTSAGSGAKILVAHRGASAYAPEHTMAAYRLALQQGADFIEPDLQVTRDGVLIALHDVTLERTTDVEEVFPERFREEMVNGRATRRWYVHDFTLAEIRQLDAGSWFDPRFAGERVPTLAEVIELARGRAGIFPETKEPETYGAVGLDMERLLIAELRRHGLHEPGGVRGTPVVIQSFSPASLRILRHELGTRLPLTLLLGSPDREGWLTDEGLDRAAAFATGIGPTKSLLLADPTIVPRAQARGLTVIPYTFRSANTGQFPDVRSEMAHFLFELGVDGLFTDNPDLFPGETARRPR
jgi:glycerophosphoryl diester phosphodiesterase